MLQRAVGIEKMALPSFIDELYIKKCEFGLKEPEVTDIQNAVTEMLIRIFEKMSETNIPFAMSQCLPTGGYFEETKIGNPDEFDFMVVCHILSQPSELSFEPGCTGCVKLMPKEPEKWSLFCENGYLRFTSSTYGESKEELALDNTLSVQDVISMFLSNCVDEIDREVVKPTGKLILAGYGEMTFGLAWQSFSSDTQVSNPDFWTISVDIMPAIECPKECITFSNKLFPKHLLDEAVENGFHIVPKKCQIFSSHACCQLSFSRVELSLVRNLGDHHKKCYKILKVISGQLKCRFIDSYALKTAMLHHHYNDKCVETYDTPQCITSVLKYLKTCSDNSFLPALFVPEKNIWGFSDVVDNEATIAKRYKHQSDLICLVLDILSHIARTEEDFYNFEECMGLFEKFAEYLSKYSEGKLKIPKVVQLTKRSISKREKRLGISSGTVKKQGGHHQSARQSSCVII